MPRSKEENVLCISEDKIVNKADAQKSQKINENETVISMVSLLYREYLCSTEVLLQSLQHCNLGWYKLNLFSLPFHFEP